MEIACSWKDCLEYQAELYSERKDGPHLWPSWWRKEVVEECPLPARRDIVHDPGIDLPSTALGNNDDTASIQRTDWPVDPHRLGCHQEVGILDSTLEAEEVRENEESLGRHLGQWGEIFGTAIQDRLAVGGIRTDVLGETFESDHAFWVPSLEVVRDQVTCSLYPRSIVPESLRQRSLRS